jgi:hypothetical protein
MEDMSFFIRTKAIILLSSYTKSARLAYFTVVVSISVVIDVYRKTIAVI